MWLNMFCKVDKTKPKKYTLPVKYSELSMYSRKKVRELYIDKQNGKCWYCKMSLDKSPINSVLDFDIDENLFPDEFFKYTIHLHHNRSTGYTLGAVHARCNAYLWQYLGE